MEADEDAAPPPTTKGKGRKKAATASTAAAAPSIAGGASIPDARVEGSSHAKAEAPPATPSVAVPAGVARPATATGKRKITLKLQDEQSHEACFRCSTRTLLSKLLTSFCTLHGLDPLTSALHVNGVQVEGSQSAEALGLEDEDVIGVVFRTTEVELDRTADVQMAEAEAEGKEGARGAPSGDKENVVQRSPRNSPHASTGHDTPDRSPGTSLARSPNPSPRQSLGPSSPRPPLAAASPKRAAAGSGVTADPGMADPGVTDPGAAVDGLTLEGLMLDETLEGLTIDEAERDSPPSPTPKGAQVEAAPSDSTTEPTTVAGLQAALLRLNVPLPRSTQSREWYLSKYRSVAGDVAGADSPEPPSPSKFEDADSEQGPAVQGPEATQQGPEEGGDDAAQAAAFVARPIGGGTKVTAAKETAAKATAAQAGSSAGRSRGRGGGRFVKGRGKVSEDEDSGDDGDGWMKGSDEESSEFESSDEDSSSVASEGSEYVDESGEEEEDDDDDDDDDDEEEEDDKEIGGKAPALEREPGAPTEQSSSPPSNSLPPAPAASAPSSQPLAESDEDLFTEDAFAEQVAPARKRLVKK